MTREELAENLVEILDRTRRIETKLTRLLSAMPQDKGVTKVNHVVSKESGTWVIRLNTANAPLQNVCNIVASEIPKGELVEIYDGDRFLVSVNSN